jgi:hypothetical protein
MIALVGEGIALAKTPAMDSIWTSAALEVVD